MPNKPSVDIIKDLDGDDSYGEEMDNVAELDAAENFKGLGESDSIINPQRRISSMRILNYNKQGAQRPPKKKGILAKHSPALTLKIIGSGWQDRIIELDNKLLKYFKPEKKGPPTMQGVLNFDLY